MCCINRSRMVNPEPKMRNPLIILKCEWARAMNSVACAVQRIEPCLLCICALRPIVHMLGKATRFSCCCCCYCWHLIVVESREYFDCEDNVICVRTREYACCSAFGSGGDAIWLESITAPNEQCFGCGNHCKTWIGFFEVLQGKFRDLQLFCLRLLWRKQVQRRNSISDLIRTLWE